MQNLEKTPENVGIRVSTTRVKYMMCDVTWTIIHDQPAYDTMCLLVNFLNFERIITGYSGLKVQGETFMTCFSINKSLAQ